MKLQFPAGMQLFFDHEGRKWNADESGVIDVGDSSIGSFLNAGFAIVPEAPSTEPAPTVIPADKTNPVVPTVNVNKTVEEQQPEQSGATVEQFGGDSPAPALPPESPTPEEPATTQPAPEAAPAAQEQPEQPTGEAQ